MRQLCASKLPTAAWITIETTVVLFSADEATTIEYRINRRATASQMDTNFLSLCAWVSQYLSS